ncbi:hypothetical protein EYF80_063590 [Liparis tanakae]|uniref:Uncharacterized protein n=1 Tax=Liparis tanakae TaxID=230148 RepID=A0A4Z2EC22_9TELE|nr:hypothetical protein EYF80_063590 [Liparis tanakae]
MDFQCFDRPTLRHVAMSPSPGSTITIIIITIITIITIIIITTTIITIIITTIIIVIVIIAPRSSLEMHESLSVVIVLLTSRAPLAPRGRHAEEE